jgi:hypothetical protein
MNPYNELLKYAANVFGNVAVALISIGIISQVLSGPGAKVLPSEIWCGIGAFWFVLAGGILARYAK